MFAIMYQQCYIPLIIIIIIFRRRINKKEMAINNKYIYLYWKEKIKYLSGDTLLHSHRNLRFSQNLVSSIIHLKIKYFDAKTFKGWSNIKQEFQMHHKCGKSSNEQCKWHSKRRCFAQEKHTYYLRTLREFKVLKIVTKINLLIKFTNRLTNKRILLEK